MNDIATMLSPLANNCRAVCDSQQQPVFQYIEDTHLKTSQRYHPVIFTILVPFCKHFCPTNNMVKSKSVEVNSSKQMQGAGLPVKHHCTQAKLPQASILSSHVSSSASNIAALK